MDSKIKIELGTLQKTLLLPLWGRAKEYEEINPLIKDDYAHQMIEKLDFNFDTLQKMISQIEVTAAIRAYNFDTIISKMINRYPDATIVNLGAGLDTTFQRVDNGKIFWYDLDLADTIELRKKLIPEGDRNKVISKSVFDRSWFSDIKVRNSKVFFMAAGVLAYFKEEEIKQLFLDINKEFPESELVFEIYSTILLWLSVIFSKIRKAERELTIPLHSKINSGKSISKWSNQIKIIDEYSLYSKINFEEHWRNKNLFKIKLFRFLNAVKMIHLSFGKLNTM
jgi:O-methyltransferase involved in polyketide biosynthesis